MHPPPHTHTRVNDTIIPVGLKQGRPVHTGKTLLSHFITGLSEALEGGRWQAEVLAE